MYYVRGNTPATEGDFFMERLSIGITNTSYGVYGKSDRYVKISEDGYDFIDYQELANIRSDFFNLPEEEFLSAIAEERSYMESLGLKVCQAHAPWINLPGRDETPEARENWLVAMKKAIRGTHALGSPRFVVHALLPYGDSDECADEVVRMNEEFLAALADYAKDYGITVCLENLPFKKHPVSSVEQVCAMVDKLQRENLKICLDTGHAAIFSPDVASAVRYIGERLEALHVHDNKGDTDAHLVPGDGIVDWDAFAGALHGIGFSGVVSLETSPKHGQFPKEQWKERETLLAGIVTKIATIAKNGI